MNARLREPGRKGRKIFPGTVKKEIATLHYIWGWAKQTGSLKSDFRASGLTFSKTEDISPFQTRRQIEERIARGGLTKAEQADLWASLYRELPEIEQVLAFARKCDKERWVYPMLVFVAHTGARRSEAIRSQIDDLDFDAKMVRIREKKVRGRTTFRFVPMSPCFIEAMKAWLLEHPGGQRTFCADPAKALSENLKNHAFHRALEGSEWHGKLVGWHVFRHSFASSCARKRVDQRMIDKWMGHQTEAMRKRYQHLFPDDQQEQLLLVFG